MSNDSTLIKEGLICHPALLHSLFFTLLSICWEERERCDWMEKKTNQPDTLCQQWAVRTWSQWPHWSPAGNEVNAKYD